MKKKSDPVGELVEGIIGAIGIFFRFVIIGIKHITHIWLLVGLVAMSVISYTAYSFQANILSVKSSGEIPVYMCYLAYWFLLLLPLIYLAIIGGVCENNAKKYEKIFESIGFYGKDKSYPKLIYQKTEGKKQIYCFSSNIPIDEWKSALTRLETGLDCTIRNIRHSKSKRNVILVTVPSDYVIPEMLRWNDSYIDNDDGVLVLGESDIDVIKFDLNRTPHVLAAGETGSGKSVILRSMLWQLVSKGSRVYMIDFKGGVEFGIEYEEFGEVVTDRERAAQILEELVEENAERLALFRKLKVKNLKQYNKKTQSNLCRIGVFIDEIAEMLDKKGVPKEEREIYDRLEGLISKLARLSRATGINLFLGVQRPDANVLTGQIKNNVPVRISGRFADKAASEIVLGNTSACDLPDVKGRFLYKVGNETIEFQSYYFDDDEDLHDLDIEPGDMLTTNEGVSEEIKPKEFRLEKKMEKKATQKKKEKVVIQEQKEEYHYVPPDMSSLDVDYSDDDLELPF